MTPTRLPLRRACLVLVCLIVLLAPTAALASDPDQPCPSPITTSVAISVAPSTWDLGVLLDLIASSALNLTGIIL